jgi:hypothetical protein
MRPLIAGFVVAEMAAGVDGAPSVTAVALRTGIGTFSRRDCDS